MQALGAATESLVAIEDAMSVKDIMKMVKEYSKESEKLGMRQEMMEEALEMGLDTGEVGADADTIYSQICDEIGVEYSNDNHLTGAALGQGAEKVQPIDMKQR